MVNVGVTVSETRCMTSCAHWGSLAAYRSRLRRPEGLDDEADEGDYTSLVGEESDDLMGRSSAVLVGTATCASHPHQSPVLQSHVGHVSGLGLGALRAGREGVPIHSEVGVPCLVVAQKLGPCTAL